ncbi:uncharacterized protein EDB91DRAFT_1335609 [Suillus paluster]|uniref:uncharacterized protein n=1 Tax=Suillus paluster TaxID=48578 RepID=UPI001B86548D|nr:uncharacterized protein EDB91DRAFT_1335609 [Suillus paluster]KAG1744646.1 hypothetical protein EDB91DRAFT_1335609 [Suillus paluster]
MWSKLSSALKRDEPTDVLSKVYEQHPNLSVFHESKKLSKVKSHLHLSRASSDATREEFNSVRSILRDPNTPGTGRNVRFFSRDVYKQDSSSEPSFPARTTRPSAMELFSPDDSNPFAPDEQATSTPFKPLEPSFVLSPTTSTFSDEISIPPTSPPPRSRSRALSDTVFQTILRKQAPEADINDTSTASLVLAPEPDPFRVNATTYYTPGTMIPPTPPQASTHSRTTSKDDDILWSLRTQLALSQELCAQYEIDLGARDELVQALTLRAESAEKEREKSKTVLRTWKKKAGELERMCRTLEEEVDTSRQESLERSVMDEASGEALRMLHRQISQLEREKEALQEHSLLREKDAELLTLREEMTPRDDAERELRDGIREAKEQMDHLTVNSARSSMAEEALILAAEEERERHQTIELAWAEERARMLDAHTMDKNALTADLERIKTEHDAANQERAAHIEDLHSENEALRSSLEEQETKILSMEEEWSQSINHISELQLANEEHTNRIKDLTSELTFAHENISRLETNILEHTTTIATLTTTLLTNTETTESLRGELASLKVSSNRTISAQTHQLADLQTQTQDQSKQLEVALRDKAESDIRLSTSKERVSSLMDEVARLRRTVHEMQQESAAREVSFVQLRKERERDREDVNGLNIALDAKQQELELIKRKIAMKAPVTPAPPPTRTIRRESMIGTPSMSATTTSSRPASSMSDVSKASDTPSTAPRASLGALTRSGLGKWVLHLRNLPERRWLRLLRHIHVCL